METTGQAQQGLQTTPFDLNNAVKAAGPVEISVSTPESKEDSDHRRWKDKVLFIIGVGFMVTFFVLCVCMVLFGSQTADEKKLWIGAIVSIGTGFLGFMVGKKS